MCATSCFPLVSFKVLSLSLTFYNLIIMCLNVDMISPCWNLLGLLKMDVHFLPQLWDIFGTISLNILFASFSPFSFFFSSLETHNTYIALMVSYKSFRVSSPPLLFIHAFISVCVCFDPLIWNNLDSNSLILFSSWSSLMFSPFSGFFNSVIIFSSSKFPFGYF